MERSSFMLKKSDTSTDRFLSLFADLGVPVAFLVPTETGYNKSIMDATATVRELLLNSNVHNYDAQLQGPDAKVKVRSFFVCTNNLIETEASLYRPITKKGDPRIWFSKLHQYCHYHNLLALIIMKGDIYIFNLSNPNIVNSLFNREYAYDILKNAAHLENLIANELLSKIRSIHSRGFLRSITSGDPGVGDTLEHALGISRNNSKNPDYKGIELKTTRITRHGKRRNKTRSTLFSRVPDEGMKYREIVETYGKIQTPRNGTIQRLQLYETLRISKPNSYGLILDIDNSNDKLKILHLKNGLRQYVSAWKMQKLREALLTKHHETFWIQAVSEDRDGYEYFRYDKILHTKKPNASLLAPLIEADKITVDLAAHINPNGSYKDHGVLFKMMPDDLPLLLGDPIEYIL